MKKLIAIFALVSSFSLLAGEIPLPENTVSFKYPTLRGQMFVAVDATEYSRAADGAIHPQLIAVARAHSLCQFLEFKKALSYNLQSLGDQTTADVLVVNADLFAIPYQTVPYTSSNGITYSTSVFQNLTCTK